MLKRDGHGIEYVLFFALFLAYLYLFWKTGIHSDDYDFINRLLSYGWSGLYSAIPDKFPQFLYFIPALTYDNVVLFLAHNNPLLLSLIKSFTMVACTAMIYVFAKDYLGRISAFMFSILVILYPTHDSTNYWIIGHYLPVTLALIMLAHYLINHDRIIGGQIINFLGAFFSYASPPVGFGLSIIFLMKKEYKKFVIFLWPHVIYVAYYVAVSLVFKLGQYRTENTGIMTIIKAYVIQLASAIDAFIGPSFILKIFSSISVFHLLATVLGLLFIALVLLIPFPETDNRFDSKIIYAFGLIALLAFGMFSLTGGFMQNDFNLTNRVTIYGSLLMSALIIRLFIWNRRIGAFFIALVLLSSLGISEHWKDWNYEQQIIISNIKLNKELHKAINEEKPIYVSFGQYSRLGPMSHIEFFISNSSQIFQYALGKQVRTIPLNQNCKVVGNDIVDTKYNTSYQIEDYVYVYDSRTDKLVKFNKSNLEKYIASLPSENRHLIQLLGPGVIRDTLLKAVPRLQYLF
ncbi:MAG: hypothetical protein ACM3UZ_01975 [Acidobacteriota bacterium]